MRDLIERRLGERLRGLKEDPLTSDITEGSKTWKNIIVPFERAMATREVTEEQEQRRVYAKIMRGLMPASADQLYRCLERYLRETQQETQFHGTFYGYHIGNSRESEIAYSLGNFKKLAHKERLEILSQIMMTTCVGSSTPWYLEFRKGKFVKVNIRAIN